MRINHGNGCMTTICHSTPPSPCDRIPIVRMQWTRYPPANQIGMEKREKGGGDDRLKKMYKIGMQAMSSLYINAKIKNTKEMKDSGAHNIRAAIRTSPSATLPTTTTARGSRVEWNVVCRKRGMYLTSKLWEQRTAYPADNGAYSCVLLCF